MFPNVPYQRWIRRRNQRTYADALNESGPPPYLTPRVLRFASVVAYTEHNFAHVRFRRAETFYRRQSGFGYIIYLLTSSIPNNRGGGRVYTYEYDAHTLIVTRCRVVIIVAAAAVLTNGATVRFWVQTRVVVVVPSVATE